MSHKYNDTLWDMKRQEVEEYLDSRGYELADLKRDEKGYYFMAQAKFCTDQQGTCEPEQRCDCKVKEYLPDKYQTI